MQISTTRTMNDYQRARRNQGGVDIDALMHYCEQHRVTRDREIANGQVRFIYTMPDGCVVHINGSSLGSVDTFTPSGWFIDEPKQTIMERIRDTLAIFHRKVG